MNQKWNDLANSAKGSGFKAIRILGFDCDALNQASRAAAAAGLQVLAGIFFDVGGFLKILDMACVHANVAVASGPSLHPMVPSSKPLTCV